MITFINPNALYLILLLPIALAFLVWRSVVRTQSIRKIGDATLVARLMSQISPWRRRLKLTCWLITILCIIVAIARPTWGTELQIIEPVGAEIVLVMDVSRSMDAIDTSPSRLERAKFDLSELLTDLKGNAISIVLFAQQSLPYMPFTYDIRLAQVFLETLSTNAVQAQGTGIPNALIVASSQFDDNSETPAIIILATDGENHEGDLETVLSQLKEQHIQIFVMGYGTLEGSPIPLFDVNNQLNGYKADTNGTIVVSKMDETALIKIANQANGGYWRMANLPNLDEITNTLTQVGVGNLTPQVVPRPVEQFPWLALLGLLLLSIEIILPDTRRGA